MDDGDRRTHRYAVVGGGGYVGFHIAKEIVAGNNGPVCLIDIGMIPEAEGFVLKASRSGDAGESVEFHKVDVRHASQVLDVFRRFQPDTVFHVASYGMSGREMLNKQLIEEVNIGGVRNVLDACRICSVECLVYTSTYNTVYGGQEIINASEDDVDFLPFHNHPDHYALTKSVSEQLVLCANRTLGADQKTLLRTCSLRLAGVYGPGEMRHIPRIVDYLGKGWVTFRYGEGIVDFVHIENVVQAHVLAAEHLTNRRNYVASGKAYFVNDGAPINNFEFFRPLIEGLDYKYPSVCLPVQLIFYIAILLEFLYGLPFVTRYSLDRFFPLLTRTEVYKTGVTHHFSIEKARRELGFIPRSPPNDLTEVVRHYQNMGKRKRTTKNGSFGSLKSVTILCISLIIVFALYAWTQESASSFVHPNKMTEEYVFARLVSPLGIGLIEWSFAHPPLRLKLGRNSLLDLADRI